MDQYSTLAILQLLNNNQFCPATKHKMV